MFAWHAGSRSTLLVATYRLRVLQNQFTKLANEKLLPAYKAVDPNLKAGNTGSFKTGLVENPNKSTYGTAINLNNIDIDFWIQSRYKY